MAHRYVRVDDPYKASYGVEDPAFAVSQLAQTTMRSELGKLKLDEVFKVCDGNAGPHHVSI